MLTYDRAPAEAAEVPPRKMTPDVVAVVGPTVTVEPPAVEVVRTTPPALVVVAVAVTPEIVPVQTLPCGQQAT